MRKALLAVAVILSVASLTTVATVLTLGVGEKSDVVEVSGGAPQAGDDARIPVCGVAEGVTFCVDGAAAEALGKAMVVFDKEGPAAALALLEGQLANGAEWVDQCHQMIHIIGHQAARDYPMPEVLAVDNRMCQDGYVDGAMEGFADYSEEQEFWDGVRDLCLPFMQDSWKAQSCAHGMGHALAFRGVMDYKEAVHYCDLLPKEIRFSCGGGVIMGLTNPVDGSAISVAGIPKHTSQPPEEIDKTCDGIRLEYAEPCLTILWTLYPGDWDAETLLERLHRVCQTAASADHCYDGYGSALYKKSLLSIEERGETPEVVRESALRIAAECEKVGDGEAWCIQGVAYSAAWWWTTLKSTMDGYISICADLKPTVQERCEVAEAEMRRGYGQESGAGGPIDDQGDLTGV